MFLWKFQIKGSFDKLLLIIQLIFRLMILLKFAEEFTNEAISFQLILLTFHQKIFQDLGVTYKKEFNKTDVESNHHKWWKN